eukprot:ANDGO_00482.mRNA.1 Guanylate cyclase 32E
MKRYGIDETFDAAPYRAQGASGGSGEQDDPVSDDPGAWQEEKSMSDDLSLSSSSAGGISRHLSYWTESFFSFIFGILCKSSDEWNEEQKQKQDEDFLTIQARGSMSVIERERFVWDPSKMTLQEHIHTVSTLMGTFSPVFDALLLVVWTLLAGAMVAFPQWISSASESCFGAYVSQYGTAIASIFLGIQGACALLFVLLFYTFQKQSDVSKISRIILIYTLKVVSRTLPIQQLCLLYFAYVEQEIDMYIMAVAVFASGLSILLLWIIFFPDPICLPNFACMRTRTIEGIMCIASFGVFGCHLMDVSSPSNIQYSGWLGFFSQFGPALYVFIEYPFDFVSCNTLIATVFLYSCIYLSFLVPYEIVTFPGGSSAVTNPEIPFVLFGCCFFAAFAVCWIVHSKLCLDAVCWKPWKFNEVFLTTCMSSETGKRLCIGRGSAAVSPLDLSDLEADSLDDVIDSSYPEDRQAEAEAKSGTRASADVPLDVEESARFFVWKSRNPRAFVIRLRQCVYYVVKRSACKHHYADEKRNHLSLYLSEIIGISVMKYGNSDSVATTCMRVATLLNLGRSSKICQKQVLTAISRLFSASSEAVEVGSLGMDTSFRFWSAVGRWSFFFESWWLLRVRETLNSWTQTSDSAWLSRQLSKVEDFKRAIMTAQCKFWKMLSEAEGNSTGVVQALTHVAQEIEQHETAFERLMKKLHLKYASNVRVIRAAAVYAEVVEHDEQQAKRLLLLAEELEDQHSSQSHQRKASKKGRKLRTARESSGSEIGSSFGATTSKSGRATVMPTDKEGSEGTASVSMIGGNSVAERRRNVLKKNSQAHNRVMFSMVFIIAILFIVSCVLFGIFMATVTPPFRAPQPGKGLETSLTFNLLQSVLLKTPLSHATFVFDTLHYQVLQNLSTTQVVAAFKEAEDAYDDFVFRLSEFADRTNPSESLRKVLTDQMSHFSVPYQNTSAADPQSSFVIATERFDLFRGMEQIKDLQSGTLECVSAFVQGTTTDVFAKPATACSLMYYELAFNSITQGIDNWENVVNQLAKEFQDDVQQRETSLHIVAGVVSAVIFLVFVLLFVPSIIVLQRERSSISRLFLLVPKRTASELSRAAQSKMNQGASGHVASPVTSIGMRAKAGVSPHVVFFFVMLGSVVILGLLAQLNVVIFRFYISDLKEIEAEVHIFEDVHQHFWEMAGLVQAAFVADPLYLRTVGTTPEELIAEAMDLTREVTYHWNEILFGTKQVTTKPSLKSEGIPLTGCAYRSPKFSEILVEGTPQSQLSSTSPCYGGVYSKELVNASQAFEERQCAPMTFVIFQMLGDIMQIEQLSPAYWRMEPAPAAFVDYRIRVQYEISYQFLAFYKVYESYYNSRVSTYRNWTIALFVIDLAAIFVFSFFILFPSLSKLKRENVRNRKMLLLLPEDVIEKVTAIRAFLEENRQVDDKEIQETVREREEKMQNILACASEGFIELDKQGRIVQYNRAAEKLFGFKKSEILGEQLTRLFEEKEVEVIRKALEECQKKLSNKNQFSGSTEATTNVEELNVVCNKRDSALMNLHISLSVFAMGPDVVSTLFIRDVTEDKKQQALLAKERAKSISLLLSIFPHHIAQKLLKQQDELDVASTSMSYNAIIENVPQATVIFSDIVGFTEMSGTMEAKKVVDMLGQLFSRYDDAASKWRVTNIKTIGDAYMAVCGLAVEGEADPSGLRVVGKQYNQVECSMEFAKEMIEIAKSMNIRIRVGMHTGPLLAAVLPTKKKIYDLFGATVNMASRAESTGVPMSIQLTRPAYEQVFDKYSFVERKVHVKGVGESHMYLFGSSDESDKHG